MRRKKAMTTEQIKDVLDKHMKWLNDEDSGEKANLHGANLHGADLSWADLSGADLSKANLHGANLIGADLSKANLHGANLIGANLHGANLIGANLIGANLRGADLNKANLSEANLIGANIDFSCWPLWCGSIGAIVDVKIIHQLAFHLCAVECNNAEWRELRKLLLPLANKFGRVGKNVIALEE
jgi:hypothetical protein